MRYGYLALVLLLLFGCAPTIPDWVDGNSALYPDDQYLIGIGHAPTRGDAEDRARAAIAKTFAVQVQSHQSSSEAFWMARVGEAELNGTNRDGEENEQSRGRYGNGPGVPLYVPTPSVEEGLVHRLAGGNLDRLLERRPEAPGDNDNDRETQGEPQQWDVECHTDHRKRYQS